MERRAGVGRGELGGEGGGVVGFGLRGRGGIVRWLWWLLVGGCEVGGVSGYIVDCSVLVSFCLDGRCWQDMGVYVMLIGSIECLVPSDLQSSPSGRSGECILVLALFVWPMQQLCEDIPSCPCNLASLWSDPCML